MKPPPDVPPLYKPSQRDEAVANMSLKLASNAPAAKRAFGEEAAQRLADTRWFEAVGDVVHGICDSACYADLVIDQHAHARPMGSRNTQNQARCRKDAVVRTQYRRTQPSDVSGAVSFLCVATALLISPVRARRRQLYSARNCRAIRMHLRCQRRENVPRHSFIRDI